MNENLQVFLQALADDADLQEQLTQAADFDEAYEIASTSFPGFSKEEFTDVMNKINEASTEIDALDLEKVAGGMSEGGAISLEITAIVSGQTVVYGGAAALAAGI